jgi:hypothetical protein
MGFAGLRFPVTTDVIAVSSYTNTWSPASNAQISNTCLIAIHTWNYYRVTQDDFFLRQIALPILQGVAVFIASRVTKQTDSAGSYYVLQQIADSDGVLLDDDFTNVFLARAAMRSAMEAMWAVSLPVPQLWQDISNNGLRFRYADVNTGTLLPSLDFQNTDTFVFPTTLFPLIPFWSDQLKRLNPAFADVMIYNNLTYALAHQDVSVGVSAQINAVITAVAANVRNVTLPGSVAHTTAIAQFNSHFDALLDEILSLSFATLDATRCASAILSVLSGVLGVYIQGGVQSNAVPYTRLDIVRPSNVYMPIEWTNVTVKLPTRAVTSVVINNTTV